jgi:hypothetical protein
MAKAKEIADSLDSIADEYSIEVEKLSQGLLKADSITREHGGLNFPQELYINLRGHKHLRNNKTKKEKENEQ